MLLIDGVKYELWTPEKEVEEFHPLVKEHYKEIFGNDSMFVEGSRLKSEAGKGSIPDGFVIELNENSRWYIVEIELSTHELYEHIVNQVGRFINGIKYTETQKMLIEAIYHHIQDNKQRKAEFEEKIGSGEIFKYISDLIAKPPILVIIIEEKTRELDEALDLLKYSPIKIIEFKTFLVKENRVQHAHFFEPLTLELRIDPKEKFLEDVRKRFLERKSTLTVSKVYSGFCYIPIKKDRKIHTEWLFWGEKGLRVEFHLERPNNEDLILFDKLRAKSAELESKMCEGLIFDDRWQKRGARIYTKNKPIELTDEVKQWAVETMIKFHETFTPLVK